MPIIKINFKMRTLLKKINKLKTNKIKKKYSKFKGKNNKKKLLGKQKKKEKLRK
jgi:hypothetical protein